MENTQDWLDLAERERADAEASRQAQHDVWAAEFAKDINDRLQELGITPLTPACTDGRGKLIPAKLTDPDPKQKLYGVYASFDEECGENGSVTLLSTARPSYDHKDGLSETGRTLLGIDAAEARRLIVLTRHEGGKRPPREPEPLSPDAAAIVDALADIRAELANIARAL